jgi:hypothetical protein
LTFACELDPARLAALFAGSSVIEDLLALRARVALMFSDFSDERAEVVRGSTRPGMQLGGSRSDAGCQPEEHHIKPSSQWGPR